MSCARSAVYERLDDRKKKEWRCSNLPGEVRPHESSWTQAIDQPMTYGGRRAPTYALY